MEYSIQQLARLAGVSARTLRYYDEIHLLKPLRLASTGYRIYGPKEVDQLWKILFYRAMHVPLEQIAELIKHHDEDPIGILETHYLDLIKRRDQLNLIIENVAMTLKDKKGDYKMTDQDKFKGLKQRLLDENDERYGKEVIEKYGQDAYDQSRGAFKNLTEAAYNEMTRLGEFIQAELGRAIADGLAADSQQMQAVAEAHAKWLEIAWGSYNREAHLGLVEMYLVDSRFTAYYDALGQGATQRLRDAVHHWL